MGSKSLQKSVFMDTAHHFIHKVTFKLHQAKKKPGIKQDPEAAKTSLGVMI